MNTLIQERHNYSESCIIVEVSRRTQKVEVYLANDGSWLVFFSTDHNIFGSNVGIEFGVILRGKDLTNQKLLTALSAYTLSRYTRTLLNTISLATRRPHCCVVFRLIQSSRLETSLLLDSTWTTTPLVTYSSDCCSTTISIELTLTWETQALKRYPCNCWYHSTCFDVQKSFKHSFLTQTKLQDGCFKTSRDSIL